MAQIDQAKIASAARLRSVDTPTAPAQQGFSLAQLQAVLRLLPAGGWKSGWTGRRDRALLVLSEMAGLSYDTIAELTVADISIAGGVATISAPGGTTILHADDDVLLCGPCALARWIRAIDLATVHPTGHAAAAVIARAAPLTERSPHLCECTVTVAEATLDAPILPVTDAWGPRLPSRASGTTSVPRPESSGHGDDRAKVIAFPVQRPAAAVPVAAPGRTTGVAANVMPGALPVQRTAGRRVEQAPSAAVARRLSSYFRTDLSNGAPAPNDAAASLAGRARQLLEHPLDDHPTPVRPAR